MTEEETLKEIKHQFQEEGFAIVMQTLPNIMKSAGSSSTKQSALHRCDQPRMETKHEAPVMLTPTYISPWAIGAPDIQLTKHVKYPIPLLLVFEDVLEEGVLFGQIPNLKYQDYNLLDPEKFPQFQFDRYMCRNIDPVTKFEVLAPQKWIEKVAPSGLLNLLRILHFVHSLELNIVVKVLLSCVHDIYLWLDCKIDVNVDIIHRITKLIKVGTNPTSHFVGKNLDQNLAAKLMKEFKLIKGGWAYDAMDIEDEALGFIL